MSKLEQLIQELCPDGVEYKKLGEICNISRGRVMSKDYIRNNIGQFPVYSSQTENNGELGKITTYDFDGEYLTWTTDGANAGSVFYRNGKFSITNVCGLIEVRNELVNTKYLYYALTIETPKHVNSGMGNPKLMSNVMVEIKVPVPPLEVQCEIVRILDKFTLLTAELTAELTARRKQYEYYFIKILNENSYKKIKLGDIGQVKMCKRILKVQTNNKCGIPFYKIGTFGKEADTFIDNETFEEYKSKYSYPRKGDVLISCSGTIGRTVIFDGKPAYFQDSNIVWLEHDSSKVLNDYLFYYYKTTPWVIPTGGTIARLYNDNILKTEISIPTIKKQKEIVSKLKYFDKLCNDITNGLPAEIELRQKQYEYYRDKLLTFKEKNNE